MSWRRGDLGNEKLQTLYRLPLNVLGLPLPEHRLKDLYVEFSKIGQRIGQKNAGLDRLIAAMEVVETAGTVAGAVSGVGAVAQLGIAVGKQAVKEGAKKAVWTVVKTAAVIGTTVVAEQGAEYAARQLGASEETIKGIQLASMVVGAILVRRRASAASQEAAEASATAKVKDLETAQASRVNAVAGPVTKVSAGVYKNNLTGNVLEFVKNVQGQLVKVLDIAVANVKAGSGLAKDKPWAQKLKGMSSDNSQYAKTFGNAVHEEAELLIQAEQMADRLPRELVVNRSKDFSRLDLPNDYGGPRPDVRLSLGNGKEAVFDFTTKSQAGSRLKGHAGSKYGSYNHVDYTADLVYER
ncbi:MAG: hypothetical protein IT427_04570 [Pirellulales bacterium]|nr:hypothetical protein [Pirellulales bacterium]